MIKESHAFSPRSYEQTVFESVQNQISDGWPPARRP